MFETILERAHRYWPVSIFLSALTFLANIDAVAKYSESLAAVVRGWRDILHGIFEFPVNLILSALSLPPINIPSPWPEVVFLSVTLGLSVLRNDAILKFTSEHKIGPILNPLLALILSVSSKDENASFAVRLLAFFSGLLVPFVFALFVFVVLWDPSSFGILIAAVFLLIVSAVAFVSWLLEVVRHRATARFQDRIDRFAAVLISAITNLIPPILMTALFLVIGSAVLEHLVIAAQDFLAASPANP